MIYLNPKNKKKSIPSSKRNKPKDKNRKKGFGVAYLGHNQNKKPLALILDVNPPTLEPSRILETIPEVKQISQRKIEFTLLE